MLNLRGEATSRDRVKFVVIDITTPRPDWLIKKTGRQVPLPILECADGRVLRESMAILRYLDEVLSGPKLRHSDPFVYATEEILISNIEDFTWDGYIMVMNQDLTKKQGHVDKMLGHFRKLNALFLEWSTGDTFFHNEFGFVETIFAPVLQRFWFLDYFEGFKLPETDEYARIRVWMDVTRAHPTAHQVQFDEVVKLYYDYAKGAHNGALLDGRTKSSFVFEPDWKQRPMPPADKYNISATDSELGLC